MSKRYYIVPSQRVRRPRTEDWMEEKPLTPDLTVYEPEDEQVDTGLVDHHGNSIVSVLEREKIGF